MLSRQLKPNWKFLSIVIELIFDKWQSIIRRYKRLKFLKSNQCLLIGTPLMPDHSPSIDQEADHFI
jgi:hypothetical protein